MWLCTWVMYQKYVLIVLLKSILKVNIHKLGAKYDEIEIQRAYSKKKKIRTTHSFGDHSTPAFIEGSLHDSIVGSRRTRPDNKRVGHVKSIYCNTQIRFWRRRLSLTQHSESNSGNGWTQTGSNWTSQRELSKGRVASDVTQIQGRHKWKIRLLRTYSNWIWVERYFWDLGKSLKKEL